MVAATSVVLQNSDRFLLGSLAGAGVLGIFAVAYNLVERPTTLICSAISTATFPLVVQVLENEGREAARLQAGRNGIALLLVALPACVGLALTADYVAASLVGPAFRSGVAALLPIMSFTALARGLRAHFIDHAFHLSGRPLLMLWTYGPATVANTSNLYVVPRYGMMGAAWTAPRFASAYSSSALSVSSASLSSRSGCLRRPGGRLRLRSDTDDHMLASIRFPMNWVGLFEAVATGGTCYAVSAIALNVGEARSILLSRLGKRMRSRLPALTD